MKNQVTYTTYTNGQIKQIKQGLRAKKHKKKLAEELCKTWQTENINGVYQKILKINRRMAPVRKRGRKAKRIENLNFEITETKSSTGITLTGDALKVYNKLKKEPKKIVLHEDHVRYYF